MEKENEEIEEKVLVNDDNLTKESNEVKETTKEEHKEDDEISEKVEHNINVKEEKETEKTQSKKEEIKDKKKKNNKIIIVVFLIIFLLFISTIFAILNMDNNKIINGTYLENINISNLTKDEATKLINEKISLIEEIELIHEDYSTIIKLKDIGIEIDTREALNEAINIGKSNNILIDNYSILKTNLFKTRLNLNISINEEKFNDMIKNIQTELPNSIKEYSYEIKEEELIITNGKPGKSINKDILRKEIKQNIINQFNGNVEIIDLTVDYSNPEKIDIEKIHSEVYKDPKDAYIVENEEKEVVELYKEENGIDFKISIEEAKNIILEEKETYSIPLKIKKPKVAVKDLGDKLFKQTLAKYTTIYDAGEYNRSHNIALAAKTINGTILLPGETFSYNGILGNTNKAKGYKEGTAYVGGKVVKSYGGGICQVSSTLYNAVLYSNLEIVERYNHSYAVSYVPAGRDATVAYGGKDFKFKNTRTYPIKIEANAKNGVVSITIKGLKEEMDKYEIVLTSTVLSTTPNATTYENNSSLPEGTEKVIQKGYIGKKSIAYKIVKNPDGTTKSKTVLSKDTYKPMNRIVQVGTKKVPQTAPTVTQPITTNNQAQNPDVTGTTTNTNI